LRKTLRGYRVVALSGVLALWISSTLVGGRDSTWAAPYACGAISYGATAKCYTPAMRLEAERRFAVRPMDPSAIVFDVTGLRLRRVVVYQEAFSPALPIGVEYDYGVFPSSWHGTIPRPLPSKSRILIIMETAPMHLSGPWRVARTVGHLANGMVRHDPWHFYAHHLDVGGSVTRQQVEDVGLKIIDNSR